MDPKTFDGPFGSIKTHECPIFCKLTFFQALIRSKDSLKNSFLNDPLHIYSIIALCMYWNEIELRFILILPKLGVGTSPRLLAHRRAWLMFFSNAVWTTYIHIHNYIFLNFYKLCWIMDQCVIQCICQDAKVWIANCELWLLVCLFVCRM